MIIQNVGTFPIFYALNTIAGPNEYHGILAAGNAAQDGLGSVVDLSRDSVEYVSLYASGGDSKVCVYLSYPPGQSIV